MRRPVTAAYCALFAVLVLLLMVGRASAVVIQAPAGSGFPYQAWADEAKVATPPVTVEVVEDATSCGGPPACAMPSWIGFSGTTLVPRWTFLHELGHQFDYFVLSDWGRWQFEHLLGEDGRPWRDAPNAPNEQFADAWAFCAEWGPTILRPAKGWSHEYRPTPALQPRVCRLIANVAAGL